MPAVACKWLSTKELTHMPPQLSGTCWTPSRLLPNKVGTTYRNLTHPNEESRLSAGSAKGPGAFFIWESAT